MGSGLGLVVLHTPFHSGWALARLMGQTSHMFLSAAGKLGLLRVVTGLQLPERVHMNSSHMWNYTVIFFFITGLFHLV